MTRVFSKHACFPRGHLIVCRRSLSRLPGDNESQRNAALQLSNQKSGYLFSSSPALSPTSSNCSVVFMLRKEHGVCAPALMGRLFEVKALCQFPFSSQHPFPLLL